MGGGIGLFVVVVVVGGLYFLPSFVAAMREHHNAGAIFALNLLLGWTALGWIVCLVWAVTQVNPKTAPATSASKPPSLEPAAVRCPNCGEWMPGNAIRCLACREWVRR